MKKWMIIPMLYLGNMAFGQSTSGDVVGEIVYFEGNKKDVAIGAKAIIKDESKIYSSVADVNGKFRISSVPSGKYHMMIIFNLDTMSKILVNVPNEGYANLGELTFKGNIQNMDVITIKVDRNEIKLEYGEIPVHRLSSEDIIKMPAKFDMASLVTALASDVKRSDSGELSFRGARNGDVVYLVDGMKSISGVYNLPSCAIGNMMVYTGGIPAKYGDTLGGVVIVESKSYFDLYREWKISQKD
jgi:hypothetical protein